jgi:hypothetical protein
VASLCDSRKTTQWACRGLERSRKRLRCRVGEMAETSEWTIGGVQATLNGYDTGGGAPQPETGGHLYRRRYTVLQAALTVIGASAGDQDSAVG